MSKKDKLSTDAYKGVRDFYPPDQAFMNYLFATCRSVAERFGYVEYGASILEPSELYKAKGSENEEIVNEQTYTFVDRGEREVTLRPEMTPTVARMVAAKRRELGFPLRLFSIPNLFRYERPQRGRLREHWQLNVDLFGSKSLDADFEILHIIHNVMMAFGAKEEDFVIKINDRAQLNALTQKLGLDEAKTKKIFALLDKKAKITQEEFDQTLAAVGIDAAELSLDQSPESLIAMLKKSKDAGITNIVYDPSIVRGFDYYTGMVFEVYDTHPDNTRALFGGGRYDNLTALFDDEPIPGVGFGMGDTAFRNFLETHDLLPPYISSTNIYIAVASSELAADAQKLADELRSGGVNTEVDFGEKKLADQIKTATKHSVPFLIVVGSDELASNRFKVRDLHSGDEKEMSREEVAPYLTSL